MRVNQGLFIVSLMGVGFFCSQGLAQEVRATTEEGKKIILLPDFTWRFASTDEVKSVEPAKADTGIKPTATADKKHEPGRVSFPFGISLQDKTTWPCEPRLNDDGDWECFSFEDEPQLSAWGFKSTSVLLEMVPPATNDKTQADFRPSLYRVTIYSSGHEDCQAAANAFVGAQELLMKKFLQSKEFKKNRPKQSLKRSLKKAKCHHLNEAGNITYTLVWKKRWEIRLDAYRDGLEHVVYISYFHLPNFRKVILEEVRQKAVDAENSLKSL